jgi:hypothetical protein
MPKESMSEPSPLNRWALARVVSALGLALVIANPCLADVLVTDDPDEPLLRYRNTAEIHGLYEVREEARKFLRQQPRPKTGAWVAVGPDIRMQAPRCAVPLRSRWARASDHTENLPGVLVTCKKTVDKKDPSWAIFVDAYVPAERKLDMRGRSGGFSAEHLPDQK